MSSTSVDMSGRHPAWLTAGFRPFFLASAFWAVAAIGIWLMMLGHGWSLPSRFDPLAWHIHEMLFGFVMAAVGGFLLTAVPNWTGRPFVQGLPLAGLAGLWLLGRIACLVSAVLPLWLSIAADLLFPLAVMGVSAREIVAGGKPRNLMLMLPMGVLTVANLLMHLEAAGHAVPPGLGWRLGFAAILVLVSVIGGRIIPTFTRNWLARQGRLSLPTPHGMADRLALGTLHTGLLVWASLPDGPVGGWLLLLAAAANGWRLWRWRGLSAHEEPLLLILHLGYGWLAVGAALLGLATLGFAVSQSAAIHALTVGAMGTMILAVMTRATRGHTGRPLVADRITVAIYMLISAAALARIAASFLPVWTMPLLSVSGLFWILAFLLFVLAYGRALLTPRVA